MKSPFKKGDRGAFLDEITGKTSTSVLYALYPMLYALCALPSHSTVK